MKRFLLLIAALTVKVSAATFVPCTDAAFSRSPYNWASVVVSSTNCIRAVNVGAFINPSFTGTSVIVNLNTSVTGNNYKFSYSIDGGALTEVSVFAGDTSKTLATGLSDTTHTLLIMFTWAAGSDSRWIDSSPMLQMTVTGLTLDTGRQLIAKPLPARGRMLLYGDSTMEMPQDGSQSYGIQLGNLLSILTGNCSFSGQTWEATVLTIPGLADSYNLIYQGQTRSFTPEPTVILNNMGYNGTPTAPLVQATLEAIRAACPNAWINQSLPFQQAGKAANVAAIKAGVASYLAAHPSDTKLWLLDLGSAGQAIIDNPTYSADGVHPNAAGALALATLTAPLVKGIGGAVTASSLIAGSMTISP